MIWYWLLIWIATFILYSSNTDRGFDSNFTNNRYYESNNFLTCFWPVFPFYTSLKHTKSRGFLVFSRGFKKGTLVRIFLCYVKIFFFQQLCLMRLWYCPIFVWQNSSKVFLYCLINLEIKIDSVMIFDALDKWRNWTCVNHCVKLVVKVILTC